MRIIRFFFQELKLPGFAITVGHDLVDQLRAYRLKVGLTQDDIAWKLGFSATTVSRWERGTAVPDLRATGAIVDFLRRADAQTERRLLTSILASRESRNLWEGPDIRYLGGSQQEYRESPEMRAVVGTSIRRYVTGSYRDCLEDQGLIASLYAREVASIDIYGRTALSMTSIPEGYVQMKRLSFQSEMRGIIRGDTHSTLIPVAQAPHASAVIVHSWDQLSRRP
jgi:transcriptional regulator with XRE-family HTH domain